MGQQNGKFDVDNNELEYDLESAQAEIAEGLFGESVGGEEPEGPGNGGGPEEEVSSKESETAEQGKDEGTPAVTETPEGEVKPEGETSETPTPRETALEAPKTWRKEAAAKWAELPPEVQAEVAKREQEMFRGIEMYKTEAGLGKTVKQILDPYLPMLSAANIDPLQQIDGLMKAHYLLATGTPEQKKLLFSKLAQDYNVDLGFEMPYVDPQVEDLQKQVMTLKYQQEQRERAEAEKIRSSLQQEIDAFAADPAHPHFDELANDIAWIIRSGRAKTLKDAYDIAARLSPTIQAKEQARLAAEAAEKARREVEERTAAAKKAASANVRSKSKPASAAAPLGSIDDTLQEALVNIKSRA